MSSVIGDHHLRCNKDTRRQGSPSWHDARRAGKALISSKSDNSPEKNRTHLHACCGDRNESEENNDLPSRPVQQSPDCEDTSVASWGQPVLPIRPQATQKFQPTLVGRWATVRLADDPTPSLRPSLSPITESWSLKVVANDLASATPHAWDLAPSRVRKSDIVAGRRQSGPAHRASGL